MDQYNRHVNKQVQRVSKLPVRSIVKELHNLHRMRIPPQEKAMITKAVFHSLPPKKRTMLRNSFGQQPPATAAQTAAATTAATQAAVTQAAASSLAPAPGDAVGFGPPASTMAASSMAPASTLAAATQAAPATVAGTITTGSYNQAAGAIQGAEQALLAAGQQLAAAQGLTGYGRRKSRRTTKTSKRSSGFGGGFYNCC